MGNMSYCRFENTISDLVDCFLYITEETNSRDENFRLRLIALLTEIAENCDSEDDVLSFIENEYMF
jgi:hypothetical protein